MLKSSKFISLLQDSSLKIQEHFWKSNSQARVFIFSPDLQVFTTKIVRNLSKDVYKYKLISQYISTELPVV